MLKYESIYTNMVIWRLDYSIHPWSGSFKPSAQGIKIWNAYQSIKKLKGLKLEDSWWSKKNRPITSVAINQSLMSRNVLDILLLDDKALSVVMARQVTSCLPLLVSSLLPSLTTADGCFLLVDGEHVQWKMVTNTSSPQEVTVTALAPCQLREGFKNSSSID